MPSALEANPTEHHRTVAAPAYRDWLGITASILCAIHCAAMPFVVGFLPALGLNFLADPSFHVWMLGICLTLALVAFAPGWRRHRRLQPALIGLFGLTLISAAAFAGPDDCCPTPVAPPAVAALPAGQTGAPEEQATCAASCCAVNSAEAIAVSDSTVPLLPASNVVAPNAEPTSANGMRLFWAILTPLGGLFLITGHLYNRAWSCRCAAGCCSGATKKNAPA